MRTGIVADASCDLPDDFYRQHKIQVLPVAIKLGEDVRIDERDPEATLRFYRDELAARGLDAETASLTAEQIRQKFLERIVLEYDYVFCITVTSTRSPLFENATKASFAILNDYKNVRAAAGITGPFALRVVDSRSMFCGTGVLTAEAARLASAGVPPNDIRKRVDELRENIVGYMVPGDLYYIRNRGIKKGENSVGLVSYAIGSMLDIKPVILCFRGETQPIAKFRGYERAVEKMFGHAAQQVREGIGTRHLCISYGGDPARVAHLPGYAELAQVCAEKGIEILVAFMSATAAVNTGPECLCVAWGGELRPFLE